MATTIQKFVGPLLNRGLGAGDAQAIFGQFGAEEKLTAKQRRTLARISERFASNFTPAGAKAWKKLTGINVEGIINGSLADIHGIEPKDMIQNVYGRKTVSIRELQKKRAP